MFRLSQINSILLVVVCVLTQISCSEEKKETTGSEKISYKTQPDTNNANGQAVNNDEDYKVNEIYSQTNQVCIKNLT